CLRNCKPKNFKNFSYIERHFIWGTIKMAEPTRCQIPLPLVGFVVRTTAAWSAPAGAGRRPRRRSPHFTLSADGHDTSESDTKWFDKEIQ
ncbi:hypothetical protein WA026_020884, partial [Henosepilachna vigintioctopunctata]